MAKHNYSMQDAHSLDVHGHDDHCGSCAGAETLSPAAPVDINLQAGQALTQWFIEEMDCPTEEQLIRKRFAHFQGVERLDFQLMQRLLTVQHEIGQEQAIEQAIVGLGFNPVRNSAQGTAAQVRAQAEPTGQGRWEIGRISAAVVLALVAELGSWIQTGHWLWLLLAMVAIALSGLQVYKKGWVAIKNRNLNINALMSIAVTGAVLIGEWPEAAMVMSLFALAEWIEARSLDRARDAVGQLLSIAPEQAFFWDDHRAQWQQVDTARIPAGSLIRVRPGDRIALDGYVEQGISEVNQAPITGESAPVAKRKGDFVYAGTINGMAELQVRTQGTAQESTLAQIARAVQQAQQASTPLERFVDRFARIYTPIVVLLAVGIAVLPPLFGWLGWFDALYKALVLLVIACPCALVISTPIAVVSGLAVSARHGVLIKGGAYLERLRHLTFLALDKTGTLTTGRPRLYKHAVADSGDSTQVLACAHDLAARSDHPSSQAIQQGLQQVVVAASGHAVRELIDFEALPGRGVQSSIDGVVYRLGQLLWAVGVDPSQADESALIPASLRPVYEAGLQAGASFVFLSADHELLAIFLLEDSLKPGVADTVRALRHEGLELAILSGDAPAAVHHIAAQLGITGVYGGLLPEQKLAFVERALDTHSVGMVGDGINDAPALAKADVGFAMGSLGSDMAIETADVAIMNDDLRQIHWVVRLSHRLHRILVENISLALAIKAVFLFWAILGEATMWMAVFADVGASLLVVFNSLRLLRNK